ncbi:MAG: hypothetical protein M1327_03395 [Candidatus Thermoplasmatota archaeon]|nr:hypothetical protein [Candidatus Thermoplasmatota archaeon]
MLDQAITVRIGKGAIRIEPKALLRIDGRDVVIKVEEIKGPCNDESCQVIKKVVVDAGNHSPREGLQSIRCNGLTIYMDAQVFRSIDMGRQDRIALEATRNGLILKGFSFVS